MTRQPDDGPHHRLPGALAASVPVLSIALLTYLAYREVLGFFFTGRDALTLIDTSRVHSFHDAVRIFSEPLMGGTTFPHSYFRPVAVLSYSLDYALWGLKPLGYHLTDISWHIIVALLVYGLLLRLTGGSRLTAWLGALLFALHPVLTQCVPGIAERHDILAAAFFLGSMWLFIEHEGTAGRPYLLLSLLAYALALGSKEVSLILPAVLLAYVVTVRGGGGPWLCMRAGLRAVLPYLGVTVAVLAWRWHVLHGLGGKQGQPEGHFVSSLAATLLGYFSDLGYGLPQMLASLYDAVPLILKETAAALAGLCLAVALFRHRGRLARGATRDGQGAALPTVPLALTAAASGAGLLLYPWLAPRLNGLIVAAYEGRGPHFLAKLMNVQPSRPAHYYVDLATGLSLEILLLGLAGSLTALSWLHARRRQGRHVLSPPEARLVLFLAAWTLLPLSLYATAASYSHRYMYLPAIPFACLLSVLLVSSGRALLAARATVAHAGLFLVSTLLAASLLLSSPLLSHSEDWRQGGRMTSLFLYGLSNALAAAHVADGATVHLYDIPQGIYGIGCLGDYTVKSWLRLHDGRGDLRVVVHSTVRPNAFPATMTLSPAAADNGKAFIVSVRY